MVIFRTSLGTHKDTFVHTIASKYKTIGGFADKEMEFHAPEREKGAF